VRRACGVHFWRFAFGVF